MPNEDHGTMWANPRFQERYIAAFNALTQLIAADLTAFAEVTSAGSGKTFGDIWDEMFSTLKGEQDGR